MKGLIVTLSLLRYANKAFFDHKFIIFSYLSGFEPIAAQAHHRTFAGVCPLPKP